MREALAVADADGYRRGAHSLKSNGNTFGALIFAEKARNAEHKGISGDPAFNSAVLDALDTSYAAAAAELRNLSRG